MTTTLAASAAAIPSVERAVTLAREARLLGSTAAILGWDQETMMPGGGLEHRSRQLAQLARLEHGMATDPRLGEALSAAEDAVRSLPADHPDRVNVRELRRDFDRATKLPAELVEELASVASIAQHEWAEARKASDFARFRPWLERIVALNRRKAECFGWDRAAGEPWDALADGFEPGCTARSVADVFGPLRARLQPLLDAVRGAPRRPDASFNNHPFDIDAQERLGRFVCGAIGFDFGRGRLDRSTHPFCGGSHCNDVRMTSRYSPSCVLDGLGSSMHETGHGMYEQGLDPAWVSTPMGEAVSLSIHESQSRLWENQVGRSLPFCRWVHGAMREHLGAGMERFGPQQVFEAANMVEPGFIRVDADEVTYPAHVILRYEIERPLIEGQIEAEDIPALWDAKMMELLGVDTRGNFKDGPLQDVHWPEALFGYFPCYSLGAMYSAQWFAAMRRAMPDLDDRIGHGDLAAVFDWLRDNIWTQASRWTTDELAIRASGELLNPAHFKAHLEARYLG